MRRRGCRTSISPPGWTAHPTVSLGEDRGSALSGWMGLRIKRGRVDRVVFPPEQVAEVKAIACELPRTHELPLSRFSRVELHGCRLQVPWGPPATPAQDHIGVHAEPVLSVETSDQA